MVSRSQQSLSVLVSSTVAFTICFAIWMYWTEIVPKRDGARVETMNYGRAT